MATPSLSELVTATVSHRQRMLATNLTENEKLLLMLSGKSRGRRGLWLTVRRAFWGAVWRVENVIQAAWDAALDKDKGE